MGCHLIVFSYLKEKFHSDTIAEQRRSYVSKFTWLLSHSSDGCVFLPNYMFPLGLEVMVIGYWLLVIGYQWLFAQW